MALTKRSTAGIYRQEIDISEVTSPAGTSTGGIVICSKKGPVYRPVLIATDKEFVDTFGTPVFVSGTSTTDSNTPELGFGSYAALQFLQESNSLYVVRNANSGDKYSTVQFTAAGVASTSGVSPVAPTDADTLTRISSLDNAITTGNSLLIGVQGPGTDGNNVAVTIETFNSSCDWVYNYDTFTSAVSAYTSATYATGFPIASKVVKVQVFTKGDNDVWANIAYSTISASPAEVYYGTVTSQLDGNNRQLKLSDLINGISQYIYAKCGTSDFTLTTNSRATTPTAVVALAGGAITYASATNIGSSTGWSYFNNREDVTVNILICPDYTTSVKQTVATLAKNRQDCIAVVQSASLLRTSVAQILLDEAYGYSNPSYVACYAGWDTVYDGYNDKNVYLPKAIMGAVLMARTDNVAATWEAPAGVNRGILPVSGQYKRFSFTEIGQLYDSNINTSRYFKGIGDVMWGQKTAQLKKSALDRINVRRLLLYIENTIEPTLFPFLFSLNNSSTRLRIFNLGDSFLSTVKAGGGLDSYLVVCDTTNNPAIVIDNNQLYVDFYLQPAKTIEFINMRTIVTASGVSFSEVIQGI